MLTEPSTNKRLRFEREPVPMVEPGSTMIEFGSLQVNAARRRHGGAWRLSPGVLSDSPLAWRTVPRQHIKELGAFVRKN